MLGLRQIHMVEKNRKVSTQKKNRKVNKKKSFSCFLFKYKEIKVNIE
jgi:hypothetical protein